MHFDTKINVSGFKADAKVLEKEGQKTAANVTETLSSVGGNGAASGIGSKIASTIGNAAKNAAKVAAVGYAAAATAAVGFVGSSVTVGKEFEAAMSKVQATSGASAADMEKLKEKALEMGAVTVFSASESAEALNYMAMAGWKTNEMLNGIEGIMNLAAASGEDLALTSDIVTDALTAFGHSAAQSGRLADILAAAASNSNTNVAMMGDTFKYVAPVAGTLSYTMEDTALAIGLMANRGIKASQAGTSLRAVLTRLVKPTKEVTVGLEKLGMDGEIAGKSLRQVLTEMRTGWANLSDTEQASAAAMIAGREGMSGLAAILNASDADWIKLANAIDNSAGAAKRMANIRLDNLAGDLEQMGGAFETLQLKFYYSQSGMLRELVQDITSVLDVYNQTGDLAEAAQRAGELIPNVLSAIASGGTAFNENLALVVKNGIKSLAQDPDLKNNVSEFMGSLIGLMVKGLDTTNENFKPLAEKVLQGIKEAADPASVGEMLTGLLTLGENTLDAGSMALPGLADNIVAGIGVAVNSGEAEKAAAAVVAFLGTVTEIAGKHSDEIGKILGKLLVQITNGLIGGTIGNPEWWGQIFLNGISVPFKFLGGLFGEFVDQDKVMELAGNVEVKPVEEMVKNELFKDFPTVTAEDNNTKTPQEIFEDLYNKIRKNEQEKIEEAFEKPEKEMYGPMPVDWKSPKEALEEANNSLTNSILNPSAKEIEEKADEIGRAVSLELPTHIENQTLTPMKESGEKLGGALADGILNSLGEIKTPLEKQVAEIVSAVEKARAAVDSTIVDPRLAGGFPVLIFPNVFEDAKENGRVVIENKYEISSPKALDEREIRKELEKIDQYNQLLN